MKQKHIVTSIAMTAMFTVSPLAFATLTGSIDLRNETEITRFDNPLQADRGYQKWEVAGFFQDQYKHPGWFGGFYLMREDGFEGQWGNQTYNGGNSVNELYLGKFNDASWGNWGAEVMIGHESGPDAYKIRPKAFAWYPITDQLHLSGYAMYVIQDTRLNEDEQEMQMMTELEVEPKLEYRISEEFGVNFSLYWRDRHQDLPKTWNADRTEQEFALKPGVYFNYGTLKTTLWTEFGTWELTSPSEKLKAYDFWRIGSTADYPMANYLTFTSELGYQNNYNTEGPWDRASDAYELFFKLGFRYLF
ncbi:OmpG porin family protein [Vibrio misgurnus]|uniref:OmpG porin family protein n=1 Tax=Vibrio misgurnus TaxID=2993714 RepID=UPI002417E271|nr:OmpG porin family protein [Vibrio sp. gvc]